MTVTGSRLHELHKICLFLPTSTLYTIAESLGLTMDVAPPITPKKTVARLLIEARKKGLLPALWRKVRNLGVN